MTKESFYWWIKGFLSTRTEITKEDLRIIKNTIDYVDKDTSIHLYFKRKKELEEQQKHFDNTYRLLKKLNK